MMGFPVQNLIVQKRTAKHKAGPLDAPVALYNPDGTPFKAGGDAPTTIPYGALTTGAGINLERDKGSGVVTLSIRSKGITAGMIADGVIPAPYVLPAAGAALGGVKKAAAVTNVGAADAKAAAGESPTKAEFDAVVAELNETKRQLNAWLTSARTAGFLA